MTRFVRKKCLKAFLNSSCPGGLWVKGGEMSYV